MVILLHRVGGAVTPRQVIPRNFVLSTHLTASVCMQRRFFSFPELPIVHNDLLGLAGVQSNVVSGAT